MVNRRNLRRFHQYQHEIRIFIGIALRPHPNRPFIVFVTPVANDPEVAIVLIELKRRPKARNPDRDMCPIDCHIQQQGHIIKPNKIAKGAHTLKEFPKTERNEVRRVAKRGKYDRETIYGILDDGFLCHVGFALGDQPYVIPTLYARLDDSVVIHGSSVSRMLMNLEAGIDVCLTVTLVDGIVLARSAFHHSMNYRSVLVFGEGKLVDDRAVKLAALEAIANNVLPGRWEDSRQPNENELNVTSVIEIDMREASAKIREGDPIDDEKDYELPIWAGVLPIHQQFGAPIPDTRLADNIELPAYLKR